MRVLLVLLLLAPAGLAHPDHVSGFWQHTSLWEIDVDGVEGVTLGFSGEPLQEGWILVLHAVTDGPVTAQLADETWQWDGQHTEYLRLHTTSYPNLLLTSDELVHVSIYYDQTCDCVGKAQPAAGPLFFNIDAEKGDKVSFQLTGTPSRKFGTQSTEFSGDFHVDVRYVEENNLQFSTLETWDFGADENWVKCRETSRMHACLDFTFTAQYTGRQLLILDTEFDSPGWEIQFHPAVTVSKPSVDAPGLPMVAMLGLLVLLGLRAKS